MMGRGSRAWGLRMLWRACSDAVEVAVDAEEPHLRLLSGASF